MGLVRGVIITALLVVLLAFYARPRFPSSASNIGLKTTVGLGVKLINVVSYVGNLFGFSPINITRTMVSATLLMDKKYDDVKEYTTALDGIEALVFEPAEKSEKLRPGLVHIHGGGWALLSPQHYAPLLRHIVQKTQSIVVSINYRRAPEVLFPVPLEDCLKATRYFLRNSEKYGVDRDRIGIKGDSAGGNLAMAVSLNISSDHDIPKLKLMALDYPALQLLDFNLPSFTKFEFGPGFLDKSTMVRYWLTYAFGHRQYYDLYYTNRHVNKDLKTSVKMYVSTEMLPEDFVKDVGHLQGVDSDPKQDGLSDIPNDITHTITNPMYAPLMATDESLAQLPTAYVMNAEFDPLRDEGFILVERLRRNGVPVEHKYWATEEHGFLNFVEIDSNAQEETENFSKHYKKMVVGEA